MDSDIFPLAGAIFRRIPTTLRAIQNLFKTMDEVSKNRGKKSFFGRDKEHAAFQKFETQLARTIAVMTEEGVVPPEAQPFEYRVKLVELIGIFAEAFPTWWDAQRFSNEYFDQGFEAADAKIAGFLSSS